MLGDIAVLTGAVLGAGAIIGCSELSGLAGKFTLMLFYVAGDSTVAILIASAVVLILLGMGMPTVAVYLMLATLVAPALIEVGINPMAAHLFILYFGMMSMITPPVAIAAFAASSLTGKDPMATGFAAMRFGWFAYLVPFLFVFVPELLMLGSIFGILFVFAKSILGIWLVSVALMGYLIRPISLTKRILFAIAGTGMFVPENIIDLGFPISLIGLFIAVVTFGLEWKQKTEPGSLAG